nr:hypothetical protein [Candidatus Sigynarchaeota archaeon]
MSNKRESQKDEDIEDYKKKLKTEMKKQLLEEIYKELKSEGKLLPKDVIIVRSGTDDTVPAAGETSTKERVKESAKETPKDSVRPVEKKVDHPVPASGDEKIVLSLKVFLKIASHALKYANDRIPKENWVEVIGLLAGKLGPDGTVLYIEDAYPMGHGNSVYAEIKDYKNFVRAFHELKKDNLFVCGWYHSHPTFGLFLSEEDLGTQARYQKLWDKSVAFVIDPTLVDGTSYGFKIFRSDIKKGKWFPVNFAFKENVDPRALPGLLEFINPIIEGKALYLEYDE